MIDRKEFAEELLLRESIRNAIGIVGRRRANKLLTESKAENELRLIIRDLISEAAVAAVAKHASTGINTLEDLLKGTNTLSVLETGYKSLTTDIQQRTSYMNHILNAVADSLAPEESRKHAGEDAELKEEVDEELDEKIDIEVGDRPEDDPDFIDVEDEVIEEPEEPDPREEFGLEGEDKTGRNRAYDDFEDIEKNILTAYDNLDNPEDMTMYEEYLIKNLALYFEKWEGQLQVTEEPPAAAQDAIADSEIEGAAASAVPEFALEEILTHLDIDDIIANLL